MEKKKWDGDGVPLAESNCVEIGSDADKAARKSAAQTEPAWESVGKEVGIMIWRIEQFKVVAWPKEQYGQFYSGDSYIILETTKEPEFPKLLHHIFFWLGESSSIDEMGTAAYKTVELDDLMDGEPTQSREVQNYESGEFKALFKKIEYLDGGVETGFHVVGAQAYKPKLLAVKKTKAEGIRVKETAISRMSLNQTDCFILDAGKKIYVWFGNKCDPFEKFECKKAAEAIESRRGGHSETTDDLDANFWELLGGEGPIPEEAPGDQIPEPVLGEGVLYKLDNSSGKLDVKEVASGDLGPGMLDSDAVMMLDHGSEVMLWIGKGADKVEIRNAMPTAMNYLKLNDMPTTTPIHMFKEGSNIKNKVWNDVFKAGPSNRRDSNMGATPGLEAIQASVAAAAASAAKPAGGYAAASVPTPAHTPAPASAAAAAPPPGTTMSLEDLQNADVWKAKGVPATHREDLLSDADFQKAFGMKKDDFAKMAQWKKDTAKKKVHLF